MAHDRLGLRLGKAGDNPRNGKAARNSERQSVSATHVLWCGTYVDGQPLRDYPHVFFGRASGTQGRRSHARELCALKWHLLRS